MTSSTISSCRASIHSLLVFAEGDFVAVWTETDAKGASSIMWQRFSRLDEAVGPPAVFAEADESAALRAHVACDSAGHCLLAWQAQALDGEPTTILAASFSLDSMAVSHRTTVSELAADDFGLFFVRADSEGVFEVRWDRRLHDGVEREALFARQYDRLGEALGLEFELQGD